MNKEQKTGIGIFDRLDRETAADYERVAMRMRYAAEIADAMQDAGLSKTELARRMGKQPSEVTKWLSGTHNFTVDTLCDISRALGRQITGAKCPKTGRVFRIVDNSYRGMNEHRHTVQKFKIIKQEKYISKKRLIWADIPLRVVGFGS